MEIEVFDDKGAIDDVHFLYFLFSTVSLYFFNSLKYQTDTSNYFLKLENEALEVLSRKMMFLIKLFFFDKDKQFDSTYSLMME